MSEQEPDRLLGTAKRAAPLFGLAVICFVASQFFDADTRELLVGLAAVFAMLSLSTAAFTYFDKR